MIDGNQKREKLEHVKDALENAPKWRYYAGNAARAKIEKFIEEYCVWYNSVRNEAVGTLRGVLLDLPDPYRDHDL